jgi:hypothetical protein
MPFEARRLDTPPAAIPSSAQFAPLLDESFTSDVMARIRTPPSIATTSNSEGASSEFPGPPLTSSCVNLPPSWALTQRTARSRPCAQLAQWPSSQPELTAISSAYSAAGKAMLCCGTSTSKLCPSYKTSPEPCACTATSRPSLLRALQRALLPSSLVSFRAFPCFQPPFFYIYILYYFFIHPPSKFRHQAPSLRPSTSPCFLFPPTALRAAPTPSNCVRWTNCTTHGQFRGVATSLVNLVLTPNTNLSDKQLTIAYFPTKPTGVTRRYRIGMGNPEVASCLRLPGK